MSFRKLYSARDIVALLAIFALGAVTFGHMAAGSRLASSEAAAASRNVDDTQVRQPRDGFLDGRLVDWLQGFGTLVAAGFAVAAYFTWRRPDLARRDSETAQLVMRASASLEAAALDVRYREHVFALPGQEADEMILASLRQLSASVRPEALAHLRQSYNELNTFKAEVRAIFDAKAEKLLKDFLAFCEIVDVAFDSLPRLVVDPNEMFAKSSGYDEFVKNSASILGVLVAGPLAASPPEDPFKVALQCAGNHLREHLAKWL